MNWYKQKCQNKSDIYCHRQHTMLQYHRHASCTKYILYSMGNGSVTTVSTLLTILNNKRVANHWNKWTNSRGGSLDQCKHCTGTHAYTHCFKHIYKLNYTWNVLIYPMITIFFENFHAFWLFIDISVQYSLH